MIRFFGLLVGALVAIACLTWLASHSAGMGEDELVRYCDVFMYMAGLRGQAGVAGPGQGTQ